MKNIVLLLSLMISIAAAAQSVSGRILDEEGNALSFATFSNVKAQIGGYTSDGGVYNIETKDLAPTDEIVFSHLGYEDIKLTVAQLEAQKDPIQLKPRKYSLSEVVIHPQDARNTLMDALSHMRDNYPAEFTKNHIIYKDYSTINGEKDHYGFFDFNMFLPSYLAADSPRIYTVVNSHEMYDDPSGLVHVRIPPMVIMKSLYPERMFSEARQKTSEFTFVSSSVVLEGEEYDVIQVKHIPQKREKSIRFTGNVYINRKDKGIRYIELHIYNENPDRFMLVAKMDTLNANAKIAYTKIDGKYMLDYITQTTYASGKLMGKKYIVKSTTSAKVVDRQTKLKMNQIVMKSEMDDIMLKEKPKDIKELKKTPDMR